MMDKKLKYVLEEIKKANKNAIKAYNELNYYKNKGKKKYYNYCEYCISEVNEILTNLEISIESVIEECNNEQL